MKIKLFILFVTFTLSTNYNAQNRIADSLKSVLKSVKNDSVKVRINFLLATAFFDESTDSMLKYLSTAKQLIDNNLETCSPNSVEHSVFKKYLITFLLNRGVLFRIQGDNKKAIEFYNSGLKISEEIKDKTGVAESLNNLGVIYNKLGEPQKALEYYSKSLTLREELGDKNKISSCLHNLAATFANLGSIEKSIELWQCALKLQIEMEDKKGLIGSYTGIGLMYQRKGELGRALLFLTEGLKLSKEIGDKKGQAGALNNIGLIYDSQGEISKSMEFFLNSLKLREEIQDETGISICLSNLGNIYSANGNSLKALENHKKSLEINEKTGNKNGVGHDLHNIGTLYNNHGDHTCTLSRQECFYHSCNIAIEYYNKSFKIWEASGYKHGTVNSLISMSSVYLRIKDYRKSLKNSYLAHSLSKELHFSKEMSKSATNLVKGYLKIFQPDSALIFLSELYQINHNNLSNNYPSLSEKEKEIYFSTLEDGYMLYYYFTSIFNQKNPYLTDTTFNISLKNKGLTLKSSSAMRINILGSQDTSLIKNYEEWLKTKKAISKLYEKGKDTKELDNKANELEKVLVKKSNTFADYDKVKNLDWKQVQKSLKKGETAIEFIHFRSEVDSTYPTKYAALIVKPESIHPEMIELFNEKDLIKILGAKTETGTDYITNLYGQKDKSNSQLYDLIWKPMEKSLKGVKTIYYSPSGLLHKISFAALSKSKDVFLCDNHRLELQGSTGKLAMPEKFEFSNESTVGIYGDINYDTPETLKDTTALLSWPYLEGTKTESEKVAAILKTNNFKYNYVAGKNASETEFKNTAPQNNIVHIATHGFFFPEPDAYTYAEKQDSTNKETQMYRSGERAVGVYNFIINKNPLMRSGLVFAGANEVWSRKEYVDKEDGVLTAQEVATLDLRKTNLVVLSACETGLGDVKGTEGVYGLQRSLKMAGVKFIIMSLWQVPDAETVEFMEKFYTKLTKTKDIKTSFYQTRNEMRKKYDPFYWAAFVLLE